jgi:hypothetical protein
MQYNVRFGSDFAVDQFGFVRNGTVTTDGETVAFGGLKHWPAIARFGVFLSITLLPVVLFRSGVGIFPAFAVIHYFCASAGNLSIQKSTITDVQRNGRQIKFKGRHHKTGKVKKTVFRVDTEGNAARLETDIKTWQPAEEPIQLTVRSADRR